MLQVANFTEAQHPVLEFDHYLPLAWHWNASKKILPSPFYWRTGDLNFSLIEVGINSFAEPDLPPLGTIVGITLVLSNSFTETTDSDDHLPRLPVPIVGLPICDISQWSHNNRLQDERQAFSTEIGANYIAVKFAQNVKTISRYQVDKLIFDVSSDNSIISLLFFDISRKDIKRFRSTLASQ